MLTTLSTELLAEFQIYFQKTVQNYLDDFPFLSRILGYQLGWNTIDGEIRTGSTGKQLRPLLALLSCGAMNDTTANALSLGVAIELIHVFSLIHDDVMDNSLIRRGQDSVWNVWGVNQAINAGDGIYGLAFQILADSLDSLAQVSAETLLEITAGLGKACVDTVQGQMLDISFEKRMIVGVDEYAQMTALKTGPLIGLALGGGALLAGSPREIGTKLNAIGRALGIAFQIQDDILGIWGDTTKTGKSSFDDLMQKKKSLPVLWALENLPEPDNAHLHALYQKPAPLDMETMRDILTMFEAHQVRRVIEARRDHYYQQVVDGLQRLYPSSDYQREIRAIVDFIVQRQY